jgi:putative FmdB family regulatory protein
MPVLHDYRCVKCQRTFEAFVRVEDMRIPCPTCGDGVADRVYRKMSAMPGKNKGIYPRFDVQLGCMLESSSHMEQIAKSRGLEIMGNQEWERSRNAPRTPDPFDSDEPDPQLIEIAKKAWDDVKYDRVAKDQEEDRVIDIIKESDVINVTPDKPIQTDTGLVKIT